MTTKPEETVTMQRRLYRRERYYCTLRIRRDRLTDSDRLRDPERAARTMQRWLLRCVSRLDGVVREAGRGPQLFVSDAWTESPSLMGAISVWTGVHPDDAEWMARTIFPDRPGAVEVPVLVSRPVMG